MSEMKAENLYVKDHRSSNPKWRDGYDSIKWERDEKEKPKE